ncbi:MAG: hypothetical protein IT331_10155 [Anaerolineae bacterium]|nr:hypothetical protein [Anaerolineae bacterium]
MNKFFSVLAGCLILLTAFSACGSLPFVGQEEPTATRRAPRPTFTPRARATPTQEIQPTEQVAPTEQPEPTDEPAPPTEVPVPATEAPQVKPTRPPAPPQPTQPPPPVATAPPAFQIKFGGNYLCDQQGVYKIIINAKNGKTFAGGQTFGVFDQGGRLLQDGAGKNLIGVTQGDINISIGSNCRVESDFVNPNSSNGELDVSDAVRQGNNPLVLRFVKSADDLTPISDNLLINFGEGGQYWIYTNTQ